MRADLVQQIKDLDERFSVVAAGHFRTCEFWRAVYYWLGLPATLVAALTGVSFVVDQYAIAGVLAITSALLTAALTFLDPRQKEHDHWQMGEAYSAMRDDARKLHRGASSGMDDAELTRQIDMLLDRREEIGKRVIHVPKRFHDEARRKIDAKKAGQTPNSH